MIETYSPVTPSPAERRRVIAACLVGTSLEWYDFFLYATAAAVVFNRLFFPGLSPVLGTVASLSTAAAGFIARPLGGIIFGHIGDRVGRKQVLIITLLLMGGATFLIGLLPGYAVIGVAAPVLLGILRFVQGIGLGGEWGGAVLMSLEHGRTDQRGFDASWPQVGVPVGNLTAAGVLALLSAALPEQAFLAWGWRIGFLLSGLLMLVGLWVRAAIAESPLFAEVESKGEQARIPLLEVIIRHPRGVLVSMGLRIGTDVAFYTFTSYILIYLTVNLHLSRSVGLTAVLVGSACQLVFIPLFGALSDRYGRRPIYAIGAVSAAIWAFVFFPLLGTKSTPIIVVTGAIALFTHAMMYGPQAAYVTELFSTKLRFSGAAGYQLAGLLSGAIAPIVAIGLVAKFDTPYANGLALSRSCCDTPGCGARFGDRGSGWLWGGA
ncbi:MAG: MHS family MFS transporter [Pseudonocardia sp.]|nr:MHS family MFS transporter [Pseudonocardia sp.]